MALKLLKFFSSGGWCCDGPLQSWELLLMMPAAQLMTEFSWCTTPWGREPWQGHALHSDEEKGGLSLSPGFGTTPKGSRAPQAIYWHLCWNCITVQHFPKWKRKRKLTGPWPCSACVHGPLSTSFLHHALMSRAARMAEGQSTDVESLHIFEPPFMLSERFGLEGLEGIFRLQCCIDLEWFHFIYRWWRAACQPVVSST